MEANHPFGGQGFRIGDYGFGFRGLGFWGFESYMGISRWFQGSGLGVWGLVVSAGAAVGLGLNCRF